MNPLEALNSATINNNIINAETSAIGVVLNWLRLIRNRLGINNDCSYCY